MPKNKLTVFGHPIAHSLSPEIHQAFAKQFNIELQYTKTEVEPGTFQEALDMFIQDGGMGANVTVPFKTEAYDLCKEVSPAAHQAKAVNTLLWQDDHWYGTNTDGKGFIQDVLHNLETSLEGKKILILGAGGAARGILGPLLDENPDAVWLANRTQAKAEELCQEFSQPTLKAISFNHINEHAPFDIIINATSVSLNFNAMEIDPAVFKETFVYDLMYSRDNQTPFLKWAKQQGAAHSSDGLGMLVEQAALAFEVWFESRPNTEEVLKQLRLKI